MNCPTETKNLELLIAFAAGTLDPESGAALEQHLAVCGRCRETAAGQASLWKALDFWEAPRISPDFDERLYRRIAKETRLPWWERVFRRMPLGQVIPIAATACLLIAATLLFQHPDKFQQPEPRRETVRVEQVERTLDDLDMLQFGIPAESAPSEKM